MQLLVCLSAALALLPAVHGLDANGWRKQSIYQVVTDRFARTDLSTSAACDPGQRVYCGGTWQGLVKKLDYIQAMGFTAVWISPVVTQIDTPASYHGFWAQDIYSLNSKFGSADDLKALSKALHDRGMYLMVDVVANHMGFNGCRACVDYSIYRPFNSVSYYHKPCGIDYNNQTSVEQCWEGDDNISLPDLRTEDSNLRSIWSDWIKGLVSNYSIDGLRIDSAKHQEQGFWPGFQTAAGVFSLGEVFQGDPAYVGPYQKVIPGILDYPSYYWITQAFTSSSGSISTLATGLTTLKADTTDTTLYGSFVENHDQKRLPSFIKDQALIKNAVAFAMMKDGIPIIYQGQEQEYSGGDDPYNREALWTSQYSTSKSMHAWIASLNQIRNQAIFVDSAYVTSAASVIYSDANNIALRKGTTGKQLVSVYSNVGASGTASFILSSGSTGFTGNQQLVDLLSCNAYTTDSIGGVTVTLSGGLPQILYPKAALQGSTICSAPSQPTCPQSVAVTFNELIQTVVGESIKIVGNITALGNWDTSKGVVLNAQQYTASNPLWSATLNLAPATSFQYKFVKVSSSGQASWENDPNRSYTVTCSAATVSSTWR